MHNNHASINFACCFIRLIRRRRVFSTVFHRLTHIRCPGAKPAIPIALSVAWDAAEARSRFKTYDSQPICSDRFQHRCRSTAHWTVERWEIANNVRFRAVRRGGVALLPYQLTNDAGWFGHTIPALPCWHRLMDRQWPNVGSGSDGVSGGVRVNHTKTTAQPHTSEAYRLGSGLSSIFPGVSVSFDAVCLCVKWQTIAPTRAKMKTTMPTTTTKTTTMEVFSHQRSNICRSNDSKQNIIVANTVPTIPNGVWKGHT